jgi:hypothetical protein
MMSSMRGGFRSAVGTGTGEGGGGSRTRRVVMNVVTIVLLLAALVFVLRRFGVISWP